jgi:hypothetical protein
MVTDTLDSKVDTHMDTQVDTQMDTQMDTCLCRPKEVKASGFRLLSTPEWPLTFGQPY